MGQVLEGNYSLTTPIVAHCEPRDINKLAVDQVGLESGL